MKKILIFLICFCNRGFTQTPLPVVLQNNTTAVSFTSSGIVSNHTSNRLAAQNNIVFGNNALNVGIGANSNNNITLGHEALRNGVGAGSNIAIGNNSQYQSVYNLRNISIGNNALYGQAPMSGDGNANLDNVAIGYDALRNSFPFTSDNVAIGTRSLLGGGGGSVAIGTDALAALSIGSVAIGYQALKLGGGSSVAIGNKAGFVANAPNNIFIGYQAGFSETSGNKLYIESSNSSTPLIGGDFANDKVGINRLITDLATRSENLQVSGNAYISGNLVVNATTYTSDARYKKNVKVIENSLQKITQIRGTTYDFDTTKFPQMPSTKQIGFIAQELENIIPEVVATDKEGFKSVDYARLTPVLVEAIKELQMKIERLTTDYNSIKTELSDLKAEKKEIYKLNNQ